MEEGDKVINFWSKFIGLGLHLQRAYCIGSMRLPQIKTDSVSTILQDKTMT